MENDVNTSQASGIRVVRYDSTHEGRWNDFVKNAKNGLFMFQRNFMEYHSDRFKDFSLMFYQEEKLIAVLPASIHDKELRSHGGLTFGGLVTGIDMKQHRMLDCFAAMREFLVANGITSVLYKVVPHIYHRVPAEEDAYALFVNDAKLFRRDSATVVDLLKKIKISNGRRGHIAKAGREGVVVEESEDFDSFIDLENEVLMRFHGAKAVHTGAELTLLKSRFPENIKLYVAKLNGELLAGTVIFVYENMIHTQYMGSNEKGRRIGALDFLIGKLMEKYGETKRYLDFGISNENNGRYLNEGLCAQKEDFGGRTVAYDQYVLDLTK